MTGPSVGFHASHEQFPPEHLLTLVEQAAEAGFDAILASDHFHPWSERQGESGHVWAWLGAAMRETDVPFATVSAPGYRYHPAVLAQAMATILSMYPDRYTPSVGSGQLLNEGITGTNWPAKDERNARLRECADVMADLWRGETVTHRGRVTVEEATLHTRPEEPPDIYGAALSEDTAAWLGEWADGLITLATPDHEADRARIQAFRDRAPDKPVVLKAQLSYARDDEDALEGAYEQWRTNCIPNVATQAFRTADAYDQLGELIDRQEVTEHIRVSADIDRHREWLEADFSLEPDVVYLHNVHPDQETFITDFGRDVLPSLNY